MDDTHLYEYDDRGEHAEDRGDGNGNGNEGHEEEFGYGLRAGNGERRERDDMW